MTELPLAYFITFTTYGTRLPGDQRGSVDRTHNQYGMPWLPPDARRENTVRGRMSQGPYSLDEARRAVVRDAIVEECRFRQWNLLALHVRTNHVHLVVATAADRTPEFILRSCKAHASQCLTRAGFENAERKRWTTHGSTRYLWEIEAVQDEIRYTLEQQGDPMACFKGDWQGFLQRYF
jgi:REP element-mobilizing transposase RayT